MSDETPPPHSIRSLLERSRASSESPVDYEDVVRTMVDLCRQDVLDVLGLSSDPSTVYGDTFARISESISSWMEEGQRNADDVADPRFRCRYVVAFHLFSALWPSIVKGAERRDGDSWKCMDALFEAMHLPIEAVCEAVLEQTRVANDGSLKIAFDMVASLASERPHVRASRLGSLKSEVEVVLHRRTDLRDADALRVGLSRWRVDRS